MILEIIKAKLNLEKMKLSLKVIKLNMTTLY